MQTQFTFADAIAPESPRANTPRPVATIRRRIVREVKVATLRETPAMNTGKTNSPEICAQFWRDHIATAPWFDNCREAMVALFLDTRYNLNAYALVSIGDLNSSIAHPREIFRPAIVAGAYAIIVMHNHPSGDPSPSQPDHSLTRRLAESAELLQIKLLDHVIIGDQCEGCQGYFSFKEAGVL